MIIALGALVVLVGGVVAFFIYYKATEPPSAGEACGDLAKAVSGQEAADAIRASYPKGYSPPPPGSMVTLVGGESVADTPENLCINMLGVWKHRLDRDPYGDIAGCMAGADTPAAITACAEPHRTKKKKKKKK
jgi:hypothetical protein